MLKNIVCLAIVFCIRCFQNAIGEEFNLVIDPTSFDEMQHPSYYSPDYVVSPESIAEGFSAPSEYEIDYWVNNPDESPYQIPDSDGNFNLNGYLWRNVSDLTELYNAYNATLSLYIEYHWFNSEGIPVSAIKKKGTAYFVSPTHIITAQHNVWEYLCINNGIPEGKSSTTLDRSKCVKVFSLQLMFICYGNDYCADVQSYTTQNPVTVLSRDITHDIAVLKLADHASKSPNYIQFVSIDDIRNILKNEGVVEVITIGYPRIMSKDVSNNHKIFTKDRKKIIVTGADINSFYKSALATGKKGIAIGYVFLESDTSKYKHTHNCTTWERMSGSPQLVVMDKGKQLRVGFTHVLGGHSFNNKCIDSKSAIQALKPFLHSSVNQDL